MTRPFAGTACLLALVGALLGSGCGGGSDASSPLDEALGYLPAKAPLVVAIETDLGGGQYRSAERIVDKFPFGDAVKSSIRRSVEGQRVNFKQIRPLLGNQLVLGITDPRAFGGRSDGDTSFVATLKVKDKDALQEVLKSARSKKLGEKNGAKLYKGSGGDAFAVKDDVLVVADTRRMVERALEQRGADDRLTEDAFDRSTASLPRRGLARLSLDMRQLIAGRPGAANALKVKWVRALRTMGASLSVKDDQADVSFRLATEQKGLSARDLPLSPGAASPQVLARRGEIGVSVRDPRQLVTFFEAAFQAADPSGFGTYSTGRSALQVATGIDIDRDLIAQIESGVSVSVSPDGRFGVRARVSDPATFRRTLDRLGRFLPAIAGRAAGERLGYSKAKGADGFYALRSARGRGVVYRLDGSEFVLSTEPDRAAALSRDPLQAVPGAQGSLAASADAEQLAQRILARFTGLGLGGALGGALVTGPLGQLSGSVRSETSGLSGNLRLTFD